MFNYYIHKYTKGYRGTVHRTSSLKKIKLSYLQKVFGVDPKHPDIIARKMIGCYDIFKNEAESLMPYMEFPFELDKYDYQLESICEDGKDAYVVYEFEKSIPWRFCEEIQLNVPLELLRELFHDYGTDPEEPGFSPEINVYQQHTLQTFTSMKFEPKKFDYFIDQRSPGEARYVGVEGRNDFVG